jgi:hypothetical protein
MRRVVLSAWISVAVLTTPTLPAGAWGLVGHTLISRAGASALGPSLPAFVRDAAAVDEIAALGPELDRSRDAGETHDRDLDPGHYADVSDDGTIFGVDLSALPPTREAYDTALRAAGSDEYRAGFLPYTLIDGWQQIAKDFAIWRIDDAGATHAPASADRAWFATDRALRQILTLRDIGVWSHYVGDASQPLHVTVHFNGWGRYPNPNSYSVAHTVHADFETRFVDAHATLGAVTAHMRPPVASGAPIAAQIGAYLRATASHVVRLYELEKHGDFESGSAAAVDFTNARLADGAAELRDLITLAWVDSANVKVGYPHSVTPAEVDSGQVPFDRLRVTAGGA